MKRVIGLITLLLLIATPVMADTYIGELTIVYRMFNPFTQEHLYVTDENEVRNLVGNQWFQESMGWTSLKENGTPVFRLYNDISKEHLYTTDQNEVNVIAQNGWTVDFNGAPVFYSGGSMPVYRMYNPQTGRHLITADGNEYNILATQGWNQEGAIFYGAEPFGIDVPPVPSVVVPNQTFNSYVSVAVPNTYLFQRDNGEYYVSSYKNTIPPNTSTNVTDTTPNQTEIETETLNPADY